VLPLFPYTTLFRSHAAVAHDRRGDAVPGRRTQVWIPRGLAIVMGMNVYPAGCHEAASGVDFPSTCPCPAACLRYDAVGYGHIASVGSFTRPIDYQAAAND